MITDGEIKTLTARGFDYLELCLDPPYSSTEVLRTQMVEIRSALNNGGLKLPVVHLPTFVWLADVDPSIREVSLNEVFRALHVTVEFEVKKAVLHPGYLTGQMRFTLDMGKHYAASSLNVILERSADLGIMLCLENMFSRAGHMYRTDEFAEIINKN